jgi:hypothetical protein
LEQLADYEKKLKSLQKEKERLLNAIKSNRQFNRKKVELNLQLKEIKQLISDLN